MLVDAMGPMGPMFALGGYWRHPDGRTLPIMLKKPPEPFDKIKALRAATLTTADPSKALRLAEKTRQAAKVLPPFWNRRMRNLSAARHADAAGRVIGNKNAVRLSTLRNLALGLGRFAFGRDLHARRAIQGRCQHPDDDHQHHRAGRLRVITCRNTGSTSASRNVRKKSSPVFPMRLDMMLVCVEAGQSLDQAIIRIAKESRAGYPALADEFETVAHEVKAGKERVTVLKDMSERVGIADMASFVTTLVQSATFGTSIAEALRVYSAEMRDKRVMRAEEKANVLPTKLTLGTMLFTLPPLLIILIGPSIHGIAKTMSGGLILRGNEQRSRSLDVFASYLAACQSTGGLSDRDIAAQRRLSPPIAAERASMVLLVGHRLMEAGEFELALKAYLRAAGEQGVNVDVLSALGSANLQLGRLGQAEPDPAPRGRDWIPPSFPR